MAEKQDYVKLILGRLTRKNDPGYPHISKITLRKNSARRRIAAPEAEPRNTKNRPTKKQSMKKGLPPKPAPAATKESNAPLVEADQTQGEGEQSEDLNVKRVPIKVKGLNEFNLVIVKKPKKNREKRIENSDEKERIKVKLPMKVLAQKLVDGEESKDAKDTP